MRIFKNNQEITQKINRLDSNNYSLSYTLGDYIYIASELPLNNFFIKLGTVKNAISATMKIEYYSKNWEQVVNIIDGTNGLANDGHVEFTPNRQVGWSMPFNSSDVGISAVVYDMYYIRISFDKTLTSSIDLSFIGSKFSDDTDLFFEYPIFDDSNFMNAFKTGKTSWEEQHIKAGQIIVDDLIKRGVIVSKDQILDKNKFTGASVCKVAEIIFTAFGNDYVSGRKLANEEYVKRLDLSQYNVDKNADGILSRAENAASQGWVTR